MRAGTVLSYDMFFFIENDHMPGRLFIYAVARFQASTRFSVSAAE